MGIRSHVRYDMTRWFSWHTDAELGSENGGGMHTWHVGGRFMGISPQRLMLSWLIEDPNLSLICT